MKFVKIFRSALKLVLHSTGDDQQITRTETTKRKRHTFQINLTPIMNAKARISNVECAQGTRLLEEVNWNKMADRSQHWYRGQSLPARHGMDVLNQ